MTMSWAPACTLKPISPTTQHFLLHATADILHAVSQAAHTKKHPKSATHLALVYSDGPGMQQRQLYTCHLEPIVVPTVGLVSPALRAHNQPIIGQPRGTTTTRCCCRNTTPPVADGEPALGECPDVGVVEPPAHRKYAQCWIVRPGLLAPR